LKKAGIKIMTNSSVERIDTSEQVKAFVKTAKEKKF
jgi:dihydrolipoamide dehydrogenase